MKQRATLLEVFSVIGNISKFIKTGKDMDLFKKAHMVQFQRSSKYMVENAKRLQNDIANGYYSLGDLATHILYSHMMGVKRLSLYKIKSEHVIETMELFTDKRRKEDLKLLKEIHSEMGFKKGICDYFMMKEDGTNIAFILTVKGRISPTFFARNHQKCLTKLRKDDIIINNKEYEQFIKIVYQIKNILITFKEVV